MFNSQLIKTDVTAVKFVNDFILAGIGNFLNIFDSHGNFIKKLKIFDGHKIHGIEVNDQNLLLFGGCYIQTLEYNNDFTQTDYLHNKQIDDWILTAKWLKNDLIAAVVMHNKLYLYETNLQFLQQFKCQDYCILYSAFIIYKELHEIVILSGTVFSEILIWKVSYPFEKEELCKVLTRLKGHNGVIFSIKYNEKNSLICSSSDDRCAILWSVESKCIHKELQENDPKITMMRKFYGHQSRVFRSAVLDDNILITAGEDSYINVWNFEGELLNKIATHQGAPVWAFDCKNNLIVVGSGACGILIAPITSKDPSICQRLMMPNNEVPKRIGLLSSGNLVTITERGIFYQFNILGKWFKVYEHEDLKSYSILEISKCRSLMALAGYHGEVYIYQEKENTIVLLTTFQTERQSRICSFHWISSNIFLTCEEGGLISLWYFYNKEARYVAHFQLPGKHKNDTWTTSACRTENGQYIFGDRRGNLYMYYLQKSSPVQILKKVHNHLGITQLQNVNNRVVSLGRDGTVKRFLFKSKELQLYSTDKVPFSWLTTLTDDYLLLAFSGKNFVVWDYANRRMLLQFLCGGGHRSWDFLKTTEKMSLAYVKDGAINVMTWNTKEVMPLHVVSGYHNSTINCGLVLPFHNHKYLFLSGSDDTTLRISMIESDYFSLLKNFKSHLSNIKSVCLHQVSKVDYLLFSGGGRGQIICWRLLLDTSVECYLEYSYYEETNEKLYESEIRVMDMKTLELANELLLFAAASDGKIYVFQVFKGSNDKFEIHIKKILFFKTKCISRLFILEDNRSDLCILITMSTEGTFTFWDISCIETSEKAVPFKIIKVHQSGIVGCSFRFITDSLVLLLTGGDDGCIILNLLKIKVYSNQVVDLLRISEFKDVSSHCAQVTGTWINENYFFTTSVDQKLLMFKWDLDVNQQLDCKFFGRHNSAVADIQGMECYERANCFEVFLYGKGMEYVRIEKQVD